MPARKDINSILILGSGPIVIGQACEFDYSGTQACLALKEKGYRVVLVNSNPATIMTDPEIADATYIEPLEIESIKRILEKERPCALLSTMGGQTALNLSCELEKSGILKEYGVELIGAKVETIELAEDREQFKQKMNEEGVATPKAFNTDSLEGALEIIKGMTYPVVIRPSFSLGGSGGGIAYNNVDFQQIVQEGLVKSAIRSIQIDEWLEGWKEYELEVVRDADDNCIVVCTIENINPMGVHTGDSITVAPSLTLTDKELQQMRDTAFQVVRAIGVDTGGSNVQFGVNPKTGEQVVVEINPRVSRSSALASKATGYAIAQVAALLAVGYRLSEIGSMINANSVPACFEPTIDYVVTKIPRFDFKKFPEDDYKLGTRMKAVGEVMAIGRNFKESLLKAAESMEEQCTGMFLEAASLLENDDLKTKLSEADQWLLWYICEAYRRSWSKSDIKDLTKLDDWFLEQLYEIVLGELVAHRISYQDPGKEDITHLRQLKKVGFSDSYIAHCTDQVTERQVRSTRKQHNIVPVYKTVDSCAGEFPSTGARYLYSTYEAEHNELVRSNNKKIVVIGSGPNRIGQGVEFDYCCVQALKAIKKLGMDAIMINCNPETVSTDFNFAYGLYFEPLTAEYVMNVLDQEQPEEVIVQLGGQTSLKLAKSLQEYLKNKTINIHVSGTEIEAINKAEDREEFHKLITELDLKQPYSGTAKNIKQSQQVATNIGYPLLARPSYVLGGRSMEILYSDADLNSYLERFRGVFDSGALLLDRFLDNAIEFDVDVLGDGEEYRVAGVMQHIEEAGVHSGDSTCTFPAYSINSRQKAEIVEIALVLAKRLKIKGLMNVQMALAGEHLLVLEVNPRASRTLPYLSKCLGVNLVSSATCMMLGEKLSNVLAADRIDDKQILTTSKMHFVKKSIFPYDKFPLTDPQPGPEMKSTGEVMGIATTLSRALLKVEIATGKKLPYPDENKNVVIFSVHDADKPRLKRIVEIFHILGFKFKATSGTHKEIKSLGYEVELVQKIGEGRPNLLDVIIDGDVALIINTTKGRVSIQTSAYIRKTAHSTDTHCVMTMDMAILLAEAMQEKDGHEQPFSLQQLHN